jgi:hypothetical protein
VCLLFGLVISLTGKRRRFFFRIPPSGPVTAGGLARSGYTGFEDEFNALMKELE